MVECALENVIPSCPGAPPVPYYHTPKGNRSLLYGRDGDLSANAKFLGFTSNSSSPNKMGLPPDEDNEPATPPLKRNPYLLGATPTMGSLLGAPNTATRATANRVGLGDQRARGPGSATKRTSCSRTGGPPSESKLRGSELFAEGCGTAGREDVPPPPRVMDVPVAASPSDTYMIDDGLVVQNSAVGGKRGGQIRRQNNYMLDGEALRVGELLLWTGNYMLRVEYAKLGRECWEWMGTRVSGRGRECWEWSMRNYHLLWTAGRRLLRAVEYAKLS